jgi:lysocardiolipin and lysophospholipid acyltransferase
MPAAQPGAPRLTFLKKHRFKFTVLLLTLSAILGCAAVVPWLPLIGLAYGMQRLGIPSVARFFLHIFNMFTSNVASGFFIVAAFLLRNLAGIEAEVTAVQPGDFVSSGQNTSQPTRQRLQKIITLPPRGKTTIITCNHRTRLDWLLLWIILAEIPGATHALKIVLKDELSRIPLFGWAMQTFRFIFMSRKFAVDEERMKTAVNYYQATQERTFLLIFPEGTDLHPGAIAKGKEFAEKMKIAVYTHVLHPRSTGFTSLVKELGDSLHEIVDLTMGYEDFDPNSPNRRPSEKEFFAGRITRKLNVLVEVFRLADLPPGTKKGDHPQFYLGPATTERVEKWLTDQFAWKEMILTKYYSLERKDVLKFSWMDVGYAVKMAPEANCFPTQQRAFLRLAPLLPSAWTGVAVPLLWGLSTSYLLYTLTGGLAMLSFAAMCVFFVVETKTKKGIDHWLLFPLGEKLRSRPGVPATHAHGHNAKPAAGPERAHVE